MNAYTNIPSGYDDLDTVKQLPFSMEAEQSVIGGLLISGNSFDFVTEILAADDFYRPDHQAIFRHMAKVAESGSPVDFVTVGDSLDAAGEIDSIGGIGYLIDLAQKTPSAANLGAYARAVKDRAVLRGLILAGQEIADSGYAPGERASADLIDQAQARVMALDGSSAEEAEQINSVMKSVIDEIDMLQQSGSSITGLSTGFDVLDERTAGLQKGDLVIVAARPSMSKTTFALNIAENVILDGGAVLMFSMEMPKSQLVKKSLASVGHISFERIRTGQLEDDEWPKLSAAMSRLKDRPLFIDDRPALTIPQIRSAARKQHRKTPLSLIVIDYLQLARAKAESRVMEVTMISQGLKALAKELGVPVIALSQLSRKVEERGDKRPMNSDLRDSGAIEQDADVIWFLYRDEVYDKNSDYQGVAEIICTKQRNGPVGVDYLAAILSQSRFAPMAHGWERPEPAPRKRASRGFDA